LLIDAGLCRDAATVLIDNAALIAAHGRWVAVRRWLAALPPRIVRAEHSLLSLQARAHMQTRASNEALDLLDRAVEACLAAGDVVGAAEALAYRAGRLNVSGRLDEALSDCARVRALLGQRPHRALATAGRVEGLIAAQRGESERALELLTAALATAQRQRDRAETAMCERSMGWVHSTHGNPGAAAAYYARAVRIWEELDDLDAAAEVKVSLGSVYVAQGVVDLARRAFHEARASAERTGHGRLLAYALVNLGELDRDAGQLDAAMAQLEAALEQARRSDDYQLVVRCLDHLAQARLMAGEGPAAEALARQALAEAERLGNAQLAGRADATLAGALLARGDLAAAEGSASTALPRLERSNEEEARVRALVVRAVCRHQVRAPDWPADVQAAAEILVRIPSREFMRRLHALTAPYLAGMRGDGPTRGAVAALLQAGAAASRQVLDAGAGAPSMGAPAGLLRVEARLLGRPSVTVDGAPPRDAANSWSRQATRELFYLLEAHKAGLTGDALVEHLWPDAPPGRGQAQLWNHVTRLRAVLGAAGRRQGREIVRQQGGLYLLNRELPLETDVAVFEAAVARADAASAGTDEEGDALAAADAAYGGPYLEDVDGTWVRSRRARLARMHARVLHRLAQRALGQDPASASRHAERLLRTDPLSEAACELLMTCLLAAGQRDRARQVYRAFARRLEREVGVPPTRALAGLVGLGHPTAGVV
ncbi:MAG TPA: BTAD domain-containing putative transcriptional regulator, partial [Chloroflexota bacterium]